MDFDDFWAEHQTYHNLCSEWSQFCILCICSFVTMETGYFQHSDSAVNSNKIPTIHCTAFDQINCLAKFGVDIYFSLLDITVRSESVI